MEITIGRIIHLNGSGVCIAAIVIRLPDEHGDFMVTAFPPNGAIADAARRVIVRVDKQGETWHDPRSH